MALFFAVVTIEKGTRTVLDPGSMLKMLNGT
jgi:hypothetical protein